MIFFSLFKTLEGKTVTVELKNDLQVRGTLVSVDQYLNLKLDNIEVVERESFPQLVRAAGGGAARAGSTPPSLHERTLHARAGGVGLHSRARCTRAPAALTRAPAPVASHLRPRSLALSQLSVRSLFIRGGVVRYVHLPPDAIETELLQDAARREAMIDSKAK